MLVAAGLLVLGGVTGVAWLVFGGGGDDNGYVRATPCPLNTDTYTPAGSGLLPYVSLEEARRRAQFEILLPEFLPDGVTVDGVRLAPNSFCPDDQLRHVEIVFQGNGYVFIITETEGTVTTSGRGPYETINVDGVEGKASVRAAPGVPRLRQVEWNRDGRGFIADHQLGPLDEEEFLRILESIPD